MDGVHDSIQNHSSWSIHYHFNHNSVENVENLSSVAHIDRSCNLYTNKSCMNWVHFTSPYSEYLEDSDHTAALWDQKTMMTHSNIELCEALSTSCYVANLLLTLGCFQQLVVNSSLLPIDASKLTYWVYTLLVMLALPTIMSIYTYLALGWP